MPPCLSVLDAIAYWERRYTKAHRDMRTAGEMLNGKLTREQRKVANAEHNIANERYNNALTMLQGLWLCKGEPKDWGWREDTTGSQYRHYLEHQA